MKLLLLRHAEAMEREDWARENKNDDLRPLTKRGITRFAEASRGILSQLPAVHTIHSSPLTRSVQTAEILGLCYPGVRVMISEFLSPHASIERIQSLIASLVPGKSHVLIGHRPDLELLASQLLLGNQALNAKIKKGGAMLLELEQGKWSMQWLLTQKQFCELI